MEDLDAAQPGQGWYFFPPSQIFKVLRKYSVIYKGYSNDCQIQGLPLASSICLIPYFYYYRLV